jgi:hypothetical protein
METDRGSGGETWTRSDSISVKSSTIIGSGVPLTTLAPVKRETRVRLEINNFFMIAPLTTSITARNQVDLAVNARAKKVTAKLQPNRILA